jgi:predicted NBD/HSP70 family sugar kinase
VFGVILGTGCGAGLVVEERPLHGPNNICGEWGHNPLPWMTPDEYPGPPCWCGRKGCLETRVSGPGMAADHARVTGETLTAAIKPAHPQWCADQVGEAELGFSARHPPDGTRASGRATP